jgi:hypothetical protein
VLVALAFCPQPPLLVPELAAGAAAELDGLRAACRTARDRLLGARPDRVVVLGAGPVTARYGPGSSGTLAGYGVPVVVALGGPAAPPPRPTGAAAVGSGVVGPAGGAGSGGVVGPAGQAGSTGLPLALTLGAWLLAGAPAAGVAVAPEADPAEVAAALSGPDRIGLLVMGDGSARRSEGAPGYVDPRAAGFDAAVAAALGGGDAAVLRDLDAALGMELLAAGVPAWRVAGHAATGSAVDAELLYDAAPYGVGYLVATWVVR